jgi:hypothetical protein
MPASMRALASEPRLNNQIPCQLANSLYLYFNRRASTGAAYQFDATGDARRLKF